MGIDMSPLESAPRDSSCWYDLFKKVIVTPDFPIPTRKKGKGLEIAFSAMAYLASCHDLVEHDGGLIAAGLASVLLPVAKLMEDDEAIQWHLINRIPTANEKEQTSSESFNMSSETLSISETISKQAISRWYKTDVPSDLIKRRAFVGWVSKAEVFLGTASAPFQSLEESHLPRASLESSQFLSYSIAQLLSSNSLGQSSSKTSILPDGTTRIIEAASNELERRLRSSKEAHILMYDSITKKGWLVPKPAAILHMVHTYVNRTRLQVFSGERKTKLPYVTSQPDTGIASAQTLIASLPLRIQDAVDESITRSISEIVQSILLRIEIAADRSKELRSQEFPNALAQMRRPLYGCEFLDIVNRPNETRVKQLVVDQPWSMLAQSTNTLVLFGSGFGELISPARPNNICSSWRRVPSGKDFLTVSVPVLSQILERISDRPIQAPSEVHWNIPSRGIFSKCGFTSDHLQTLSFGPQQAEKLLVLKRMLDEGVTGAVIFGKKSQSTGHWDTKLLLEKKSVSVNNLHVLLSLAALY
jgi:hypothetical protein